MKELYSEFVLKLKKLYGKFDESNKRFEKRSNSEISRELGYSDAQFSRLINETATDGEYQRAIQNVDRILKVAQLEQQLESAEKPRSDWKRSIVWFLLTILLASAGSYLYWIKNSEDTIINGDQVDRDNTLKWSFETSFINPYSKLDELPDDCDFPCYKYQGKWTLKKGYKIPFFRERNGFHYLATEVNMYARCMPEKSENGEILEGYEYQKHEIWYDMHELPLDSFTVEGNQLQEYYQNLDFNTTSNFVKVATVHTFFRNEFTIEDSLIQRVGKVIGRDLEFEEEETLIEQLGNRNLVNDLKNEINRIASNRLEDFSRPISCNAAVVPDIDFHNIKDGAEMSFSCQLTTNRVSFHYTKTFVLDNQYIKNRCQTPTN